MSSELITRQDLMRILTDLGLGSAVIVETGTDGVWSYRKFSDGTYDAWFDEKINLLAGTLWSGGFYYHLTSSEYPAPSFSKSVTSRNAHANSAVLLMYAGHNGNQYYFANASSAALSAAIHAEVKGTW